MLSRYIPQQLILESGWLVSLLSFPKLLFRSRREELRKGGWEGERRVVMEEDEEEEIHKQRINRKRKGSVKDRLDWSDKMVKVDKVIQDRVDWSDKVMVVEEEQEAETFIENKETLASLDYNFEKKLVRPRMGMVADMVEAEQR